jgi:hypothetical protein
VLNFPFDQSNFNLILEDLTAFKNQLTKLGNRSLLGIASKLKEFIQRIIENGNQSTLNNRTFDNLSYVSGRQPVSNLTALNVN